MNTLLRTAAVALAGFTAFLSLYAPQPLLPTLAQVFGASAGQVSVAITMGTLGMAIFSPFAGALSDRIGRRRLILIASFALAFFSTASALTPNLPLFLVSRFLLGAVTPGVVAVTVAYIHEEWPAAESGRATSAYIAGTIIGGFAGRLIAGIIVTHASWHMAFLALGLINLLCAIALLLWLPVERHERHPANTAGWAAVREHLRNGKLIATYAVGFCILFTLTSSFTYINFHLAAPPFRLAPAALGTLFFVYLAGAAFTLVAGRLIDSQGHRWTLLLAIAIGITGILLTLSTAMPAIVIGLALCCCGVFGAQAAANSFLGKAATHNRALAIGLYGTFYYGGGAVGAAAPGLLWNAYGWTGCVLLILAVQLSSMAMGATLWPAKSPSHRH